MTALASRIRSIEERLESLDLARLRAARESRNAEMRIETGTATAVELDVFLAPRIEAETEELISNVLTSAARGRRNIPPADRGLAAPGLAIELLVCDSTRERREEHYRVIEAMASRPPLTPGDRVADSWGPRLQKRWIEANLYLRILGEDHGEELRASISNEVNAEVERAEALEQERHDAIDAGTAEWEDFYFEFRDRLPIDQPLIRAEAKRRVVARARGTPLSIGGTPFDWVSEIGSHPPITAGHPREHQSLKEARRLLRQACEAGTPVSHPNHGRWLDAWRWRSGLGGGMGYRLRTELAADLH